MERLRSDERPEITFIIQMIEKLLNESDSLETALQQLADLDETGIEAVEKMIEQREMTIRRMLDILEVLVRERNKNEGAIPYNPNIAHVFYLAGFIPASNEPSGHAGMSIWRLPRGSNTPMLA